jgi:hypothetical protein
LLLSSQFARAVVTQLATLNDQLCYSLFAEEEVTAVMDTIPVSRDRDFSTVVFPHNSQAPRLHVRVADLRNFQARHRESMLAAYVSSSYEVAASYYGPAIKLVEETNAVSCAAFGDYDGPEERFALQVAAHLTIPVELLNTIKYIRLRRNQWVHRLGKPTDSWRRLARYRGKALNAYWGTDRLPLDFSVAHNAPLVEREAFALLKLLRVAIQRVDHRVVDSLPRSEAIFYCGRRSLSGDPELMNPQADARSAQKLQHVVRSTLGIEVPLADTEAAIPVLRLEMAARVP